MVRKVKLNHSFVFHECSMIIEITIFTYAIAWKCMYCCALQFLIFYQTFRCCMLFSFLLKEFRKLFVPWCCITEKGVCKSISVTLYIHRCIHAVVWRKQFIFFPCKIYLVTTDKWWRNLHVWGHGGSQGDEIAGIMLFISRDICNDYVIKLTPWSMSWEANSFSSSQEILHLMVSSIWIFRLKFVCIYNDYNIKHNVCYGITSFSYRAGSDFVKYYYLILSGFKLFANQLRHDR